MMFYATKKIIVSDVLLMRCALICWLRLECLSLLLVDPFVTFPSTLSSLNFCLLPFLEKGEGLSYSMISKVMMEWLFCPKDQRGN